MTTKTLTIADVPEKLLEKCGIVRNRPGAVLAACSYQVDESHWQGIPAHIALAVACCRAVEDLNDLHVVTFISPSEGVLIGGHNEKFPHIFAAWSAVFDADPGPALFDDEDEIFQPGE